MQQTEQQPQMSLLQHHLIERKVNTDGVSKAMKHMFHVLIILMIYYLANRFGSWILVGRSGLFWGDVNFLFEIFSLLACFQKMKMCLN